jgi:DNA-binding response OmpR family regulator
MITLLIIEDERPLLEEVSALLSFEDFDVLTADNGWSGVQLAQDRQPDLIICDITMEGMDGYEVLSELRKSPQTMAIPFMFLTARSDKSFMRYGMELGADDYLTSHISITLLSRLSCFQSLSDELNPFFGYSQ